MFEKRGSGKRATLLVGSILLAVLGIALYYREALWAGYLQYHWKRIDVVVLDDCDPDYKGTIRHKDGVGFLDENGHRIRYLDGLNNCEAIGANHGIALDPERCRIYVREFVSRRITALDSAGNILFRMEGVEADALAVDAVTGSVWCVGGSSIDQGDLKVFDTVGTRVAMHPLAGFDIAYNPFDQTFWIAGRGVMKCDREGSVMARIPGKGWAMVSVSPNPRDGGAWVVEREHPQVRNSSNRLLRLDVRGNVTREIELGTTNPFGVACDPGTGTAWMVEYGKSIVRVPVEGPPLDPIPVPATAIGIGARTGSIWVSTKEGVMKLDRDGVTTVSAAFTAPSSQTWLAAP
jgi:hypothetical protein